MPSQDRSDDVLFSLIPEPGLQPNGGVVGHVGLCNSVLTNRFGIEPFLGLSGFIAPLDFKRWIESCIDSKLDDWEPCELVLYSCWMESLAEQYPGHPGSPSFCYQSWLPDPDPRALKSTPTTVYAIRHRAFSSIQESSRTAFHCARQKSYAELSWQKTHPGEAIAPHIMDSFTDTGFYLATGGNEHHKGQILTWPMDDLEACLAQSSVHVDAGQDLMLCSAGVCVSLGSLTESERSRLVAAHKYYGPEMAFLDLLRFG